MLTREVVEAMREHAASADGDFRESCVRELCNLWLAQHAAEPATVKQSLQVASDAALAYANQHGAMGEQGAKFAAFLAGVEWVLAAEPAGVERALLLRLNDEVQRTRTEGSDLGWYDCCNGCGENDRFAKTITHLDDCPLEALRAYGEAAK